MIIFCPHCGHRLETPLKKGITSCLHCNRIFDSSSSNRLLSIAWLVRRQNYTLERLQFELNLPSQELEFINKYVIEGCYSHDDLLKIIKNDLDPAA